MSNCRSGERDIGTRNPRGWWRSVSVAALPGAGLLACILAWAPARGDEAWLTETDWVAEIPTVLHATRHEQRITRAPSSVTIISRDMIEAQGAFNVAEILRLVPGFQAFSSNGFTFGVTPHGFTDRNPRRTEVRVNGRSVFLPLLSSVAWEFLGIVPDDIDHIEVVRGSNTPAYGSNAILGAINIVTRNPVGEAGGVAAYTAGSAGTQVAHLRHNIVTAQSNIQVRAAYKETDGFGGGVKDSGFAGHLVLNGVFTPNLSNTLEYELGYVDGQFGVGDGDHLDEFVDEDREGYWLHGSWQGGREDNQFKLRASYSEYRALQLGQLPLSQFYGVPAEVIPAFFPGQVDEYIELSEGDRRFSMASVEFEHLLRPSAVWQGVWGLGHRIDQLNSDHYLDGNNISVGVNYLFANVEWQFDPRWVFNGGFMLEDRDGIGSDVSPRLSLNFLADDNHTLRVSVTRAFRQPALLESERLGTIRFADGTLIDLKEMSLEDIRPERVDSVELGYLYYSSDRELVVDLKLFYEDIEDAFISGFDAYYSQCQSPTPEIQRLADKYCPSFYVGEEFGAFVDERVRVFTNTAGWTVEGLELETTWHLDHNTWVRLDAAYLMFAGMRDRRLNRPRYSVPIDNALPRKSAGLLLGHSWGKGWRVGSYLQYVDEISWRSGTRVDSHWRWDVNLARTWRFGGAQLQAKLTLQNLAKDTYLEFQQNNDFARRAYLSLAYIWP